MAEGYAHKIGSNTYVALRLPVRWTAPAELAATAEWVIVYTWPGAPPGGVQAGWLTRGDQRGGFHCYLGSGRGIQVRQVGSAAGADQALRLVAEAHQRRQAKKLARKARRGDLTRQQAKRAKWEVLAVCTGCRPELNMPFSTPADRDRWADTHTARTGHPVTRKPGTPAEGASRA